MIIGQDKYVRGCIDGCLAIQDDFLCLGSMMMIMMMMVIIIWTIEIIERKKKYCYLCNIKSCCLLFSFFIVCCCCYSFVWNKPTTKEKNKIQLLYAFFLVEFFFLFFVFFYSLFVSFHFISFFLSGTCRVVCLFVFSVVSVCLVCVCVWNL